jgi:hypothetical protein
MKQMMKFLLLIPLILAGMILYAQENAFNTWTTIDVKYKLQKKWELSAETELRTLNFFEHTNRLSLELDGTYKINKHLLAGAGYMLMNFYDSKYDDYQLRNRFNAFVTGRQKLGDFTFSLREKLQLTIKDDSDRIDDDGEIDTYNINPALTWRNKLKIEYNIPKFPVTPSFSFESFRQLNNPDRNVFDSMRYDLSFDYKINKHNKLELYGLLDHEINVKNPVDTYVIGIGYSIDF